MSFYHASYMYKNFFFLSFCLIMMFFLNHTFCVLRVDIFLFISSLDISCMYIPLWKIKYIWYDKNCSLISKKLIYYSLVITSWQKYTVIIPCPIHWHRFITVVDKSSVVILCHRAVMDHVKAVHGPAAWFWRFDPLPSPPHLPLAANSCKWHGQGEKRDVHLSNMISAGGLGDREVNDSDKTEIIKFVLVMTLYGNTNRVKN